MDSTGNPGKPHSATPQRMGSGDGLGLFQLADVDGRCCEDFCMIRALGVLSPISGGKKPPDTFMIF